MIYPSLESAIGTIFERDVLKADTCSKPDIVISRRLLRVQPEDFQDFVEFDDNDNDGDDSDDGEEGGVIYFEPNQTSSSL